MMCVCVWVIPLKIKATDGMMPSWKVLINSVKLIW